MCGIYGVLQLDGEPAFAEALAGMGRRIVHRGPDDEGHYCNGPIALGMRRLSIIDLAGGHQPLTNEDGSVWLVANGEIYNFRELQKNSPRRVISSRPDRTVKPCFIFTRVTVKTVCGM